MLLSVWINCIRDQGNVWKRKIRHFSRHRLHILFFLFGLLSIVWVAFRSGVKPARLAYPCQQAAVAAGSLWYATYIVPLVSIFLLRKKYRPGLTGILVISGIILLSVFSAVMILNLPASGAKESLATGTDFNTSMISNVSLSAYPSAVYVLDDRSDPSGIPDLIEGMGAHGFLFYRSPVNGKNSGPSGLIGGDDVVLIKVNCQWNERGGTNTDVVEGLIEAIMNHPDGFSGEIVIVDNGQGRGSFTWDAANAIDHSQSIQSVADSFSSRVNISTFLWDNIRNTEVTEYNQGNANNGYVVNHTANPRTGIYVSYPKFRTVYGTNISLKNGIWKNGAYNNTRLKLINVPVLKTHSSAGVTGCVKHYVGVLSVPKTDGLAPVAHGWIYTGGLGTQMVESRVPDLNIVDATWVNAIPKGYPGAGPGSSYAGATFLNVLLAGTDPVALDYYGAKHLLMPAASRAGYSDLSSMNPDSATANSFGAWLKLSRNELLLAGYPATTNESQIQVIPLTPPFVSSISPGSGFIGTEVVITSLDGSGFRDNAVITLTRSGQSDIAMTEVNITPAIITGTFNLTGATVGLWNVTVTNPDGLSGRLMNGFRVLDPLAKKTGLGVFLNGGWWLDGSRNGIWDGEDTLWNFGSPGCQAVVGDWNGDGIDEVGVFLNGGWWLDSNGNGVWDEDDALWNFGSPGCQAVAGDWNGDGIDEMGVFLKGGWWLDANGNNAWDADDTLWNFGSPGCQAIVGDWNGDETSEVGVFMNGRWWLDSNGSGVWDEDDALWNFGSPGCQAVVGDWNGDGTKEIGVFLNGGWWLDDNGNSAWDVDDTVLSFGSPGCTAVVGDFG